MEEGPGRLEALGHEHNHRDDRKDEQHYRDSDGQIDRAFAKPVERILKRLLPQADEAETAIFEMGNRMAQTLLEVTKNKQPDSELIANPDNVLICFG
jgi:hypothetical protein